MKGNANVDIQ